MAEVATKKTTSRRTPANPPPPALPGSPPAPTRRTPPPVILNVAYLPLSDRPELLADVRVFGTDKAAYAFARSPEGRGWSFVDVEKGASIAEAIKADQP